MKCDCLSVVAEDMTVVSEVDIEVTEGDGVERLMCFK